MSVAVVANIDMAVVIVTAATGQQEKDKGGGRRRETGGASAATEELPQLLYQLNWQESYTYKSGKSNNNHGDGRQSAIVV